MWFKHVVAALVGGAALLLTACTVVPLDENGKPIIPADPNAKENFDNLTPQQVAQKTWQSRVIDVARQQALDTDGLLTRQKSPSATTQNVFVRFVGKVDRVDTANPRERKLVVIINDQPLEIQSGPVMRGNTLRDAAGFRFDEFTNQVQFAQLSREFNREAVKHLPEVDNSWQGKQITVVFAANLNAGKVENATALELKQEAE